MSVIKASGNVISLAVGAAVSCVVAKLLVTYTDVNDLFVVGAIATTVGLAATAYLIDRQIKRENMDPPDLPPPRSIDQIMKDRGSTTQRPGA